jgi:uncharacterized membrane protein YbhN (UPF0104 family)
MLRRLRRRLSTRLTIVIGLLGAAVAVAGLAGAVDGHALRAAARAMADDPAALVVALTAFGAAFALRAVLWTRVLPGLQFRHALAGVHLATGANHVLPLRLGEPLRVVSVVKRTTTATDAATSSTVALRSADIVAVALLGWLIAPTVFGRVIGVWGWLVFAAVAVVGVAGVVWMQRTRVRDGDHGPTARIRLPGLAVAAGSMLAWGLEAVLVWQCARFAGIELTAQHAVVVTAVAVSAQVVAITPGGIGTYEAASVAAYTALGYDAALGLVAAVATHALKTIYTLVAGGIALLVPAPGLAGRLRVPRRAPQRPPSPVPSPGPVVLFLPAHDEEATVGAVLARAPAEVLGHPVECIVVDDGSTDGTAANARSAGAAVTSTLANRGLGAAVRTGLEIAVARGASAVAFCDADGEYDPAELARLVEPILRGEADYVVGSRFSGTIESMRPHRRLGNRVLTRVVSYIARTPITDGQSGYRALSSRAATHAEIVHDYNYAQVLTLDLLGKGFVYREVPITYRFRSTGHSFVKLGRYLANVVPAVHRELNTLAVYEGSILDDVAGEAVAGTTPIDLVEPAVGAERVGGGRAHREDVMGVVGDVEALPTEGQQALLR